MVSDQQKKTSRVCVVTDAPVLLLHLSHLHQLPPSPIPVVIKGMEEEQLSQSVRAAFAVASCSRDVLVLYGGIRITVGALFCILTALLLIS